MHRDTIPGLAIVMDVKPQPAKKRPGMSQVGGQMQPLSSPAAAFGELGKIFDLSNLPLSQLPEECREDKEPRGFH